MNKKTIQTAVLSQIQNEANYDMNITQENTRNEIENLQQYIYATSLMEVERGMGEKAS